MLSQSNQVHAKATERLFLAVVNQAISDVLENGKEAKEAEQWLLSKDRISMPWTDCSCLLERPWELCCQKEINEKPNSETFAALIHGRWPVKNHRVRFHETFAGFEHQKLKSILRHRILVDVRLRRKPSVE